MGAWGYGITEDDAAMDAYEDYIDGLNAGLSKEAIEANIRAEHAEPLADEDDAVSVELGLAKAQWDCGHVTPATFKRIERIIETNAGMALWDDAGPKAAAARRKALNTFLAKLTTTNPRPKKKRKPRYLKPAFSPGDCLAILDRSTGNFAAAIVLFNPIEKPRPGQDIYGINSLGFLDYEQPTPPPGEFFEIRSWMYRKATWSHTKHDFVIAVAHPNRLMWNMHTDPKWLKKFNRPTLDVRVVGHTSLRHDEALPQTFFCDWRLDDHEFSTRVLAPWRIAKSHPATRLYRTQAEIFERYPDLKGAYTSVSEPLEFDMSPLKQ
jgi:hypothetical protein